jgi:alpha-beta hydrolase superfamily lysophospholipase
MYDVPDPPLATQFQLRSPRGAKLAARAWPCPSKTKPVALALLVHGYGDHSGYYGELARRLNLDGVYCASYDQVGHGYSEAEPDAPDGLVHVSSFEDWVEDVFAALAWARSECGYTGEALPTFLFGESLGELQVLVAALQSKLYGVQLSGVITSSAVLQVHPDALPPKPVATLMRFLAPYYPKFPMPNDPHRVASYDSAFGDPEWARTFRSDEKVLKAPRATLGAVVGVWGAGEHVLRSPDAFPCPLLAIHAKGDSRVPIGPMLKLVDQLGPHRARGVWVDSAGHQLLQDKRRVPLSVIEAVASWIVTQASEREQK